MEHQISFSRKRKDVKMQKLNELSKNEIKTISHRIADAFYDYRYNSDDEGLLKYISNHGNMFIYVRAIVQAAYNNGLFYTTSSNRERYLI